MDSLKHQNSHRWGKSPRWAFQTQYRVNKGFRSKTTTNGQSQASQQSSVGQNHLVGHFKMSTKAFEARQHPMKTVNGWANCLVVHCKNSMVSTKALEAKQQQMDSPKHRLIQLVKTRWNSIFEMVERLIEVRCPICGVLTDKKCTKLVDAQTLNLKPDR